MDRINLGKTFGWLVALAIVLAAAPASAGRIVVLSVKGDDTGEFEELLTDAVDDEHSVVASQAFERAARREGVDDEASVAGIAKVVRSLEADAVLDPMLARESGEYLLTIKVRGKNGKVKKKMSVSLDAPRLGPKGKKKVAKQLLVVIGQVVGKNTGKATRPDPDEARDEDVDDEDEEVAAPPPKAKKPKAKPAKRVAARDRELDDEDAQESDDDDADRPAKARDAEDEDEDPLGDDAEDGAKEGDDDDEAEEERPRRKGGKGRELRRAGILVEVGSTAMTRRLTFSSRAAFDQAPNGYQGNPVPAGHVAAEVFPVAIALPHNAAGGVGMFFEYDRVLSLTTRTTEAMNVALPTRQIHWTVGGKLRYAFGSKPSYPSIVLGAGYGRRAFIVDRSPLPAGAALDLPDVDYRVYEPSLMLRVPLGTPRLALAAVGKAMLFKSAGGIQSPDEYGAAKITGVEGEAILDVGITSMVMLRLRGSFAQIGYDFTGNGVQTNSRDNDPDTQDVGGALDRWFGGSASLGVYY